MAQPAGLHIVRHSGGVHDGVEPPVPIVFVHGSLDRGDSFRRVIRRLPEHPAVTYDRRGYGASGGPPVHLDGHISDLLALLAAMGEGPEVAKPVVVGHSFGADVVLGAALREPGRFRTVAAYEPPMPWLGFKRPSFRRPLSEDPAVEVERFFRRMVGDAAWERLPERQRARRIADGPALLADMTDLRGPEPFDVTALSVPVVFARGGSETSSHHRAGVEWLSTHVPGALLYEIPGATHGAHLSHPDHFAEMVRAAVRAESGQSAQSHATRRARTR